MDESPGDLPLALRRRPSQAQARLSAMARGSPSRSPLLAGAGMAQQIGPPPQPQPLSEGSMAAAPIYVPLPSMSESTLLQLHRQLQLAAQHAARMQAAAAAAEAEAAAARRAAAMLQPGATIPCVCPHMAPSALAAIAPGQVQPRCTCGAAAAASSAESSAAAAASPAEAAPSSGVAVTEKAAEALQRSVAWAKSASRLRSSLLSAYAAWQWFAGKAVGSGGGGGGAHHSGDLVAAAASGSIGGGASAGAGFLTPVELVSPHMSDALASVSGMVRNASSAGVAAAAGGMSRVASSGALQSLAQRAFGPTSSASRQSTLHALRRLLRALVFFVRVHSRRFHRLLRPHLLLLLRSRALSRLGGMLFPFLRRNLLLASHVAFVYGSVLILLKRYMLLLQRQSGHGAAVAAGAAAVPAAAQDSVLGSLIADVRAALAQLLAWTAQRWSSLPLAHKAALAFAATTLLFLLFTCVQIVREYRRHRAARRKTILDARAADTIAALQLAGVGAGRGSAGCGGGGGIVGGGWSPEQLHALLLSSASLAHHSPDVSPEPSPDPSPLHTPCLSASASRAHGLDALAPDDDDAAEGQQQHHLSPSRHHAAYSFHSGCSACVASVFADSAVSASYTHDHPPGPHAHGQAGAAQFHTPSQHLAAVGAGGPGAEGGGFGAGTGATSLQMYPLVSAISRRMEWPPVPASAPAPASGSAPVPAGAASLPHGGVAPGTPVELSSASALPSLSFISPASRRLTSIKLSKLRQQEDSFERVRPALHEHMQLAYLQQQDQVEQQQHEQPELPSSQASTSQQSASSSSAVHAPPSRPRRKSSGAVAAMWRPTTASASVASSTAAAAATASTAASETPARSRSAAPHMPAHSDGTPRRPSQSPPPPRPVTPQSAPQLIDDEQLLDVPAAPSGSSPSSSSLSPRSLADAVGSATSTFRSLFLRQR